jgi:hypothetical protein
MAPADAHQVASSSPWFVQKGRHAFGRSCGNRNPVRAKPHQEDNRNERHSPGPTVWRSSTRLAERNEQQAP